ncbi:FAD-binding protein [Thioclava indica]|uniref:FAD-dependent oxidoreductase 2 FAD-binding domain-containing protein n=1 Tax=Thioclava indica TaxID=1353528 RepID=A0A074JVH4_9RHOB|nr:FAD-binding protein [Thioclava indica]KEO61661.1 hypothetical protein DT23_01430 [Thioclava indica]
MTGSPTRRQFLTLGGASIAALGTGVAGPQNKVKFDPGTIPNTDYATGVLVIGGGMAGLFAAVKAHDAGARTMIVSKGRLGSSGLTPFAKGFFTFDPTAETLSIDEFVAKVQRSALGTANTVAGINVMAHQRLTQPAPLRRQTVLVTHKTPRLATVPQMLARAGAKDQGDLRDARAVGLRARPRHCGGPASCHSGSGKTLS